MRVLQGSRQLCHLGLACWCLVRGNHVAEMPASALLSSSGFEGFESSGGGLRRSVSADGPAFASSVVISKPRKVVPGSSNKSKPSAAFARRRRKTVVKHGSPAATVTTTILDPNEDAVAPATDRGSDAATLAEEDPDTDESSEDPSPKWSHWKKKKSGSTHHDEDANDSSTEDSDSNVTAIAEAPTSEKTKSHSARHHTGGSLPPFLAALAITSSLAALFLFVFGLLRKQYPLVYGGAVMKVPLELTNEFAGWLVASYSLRMDEVTYSVGLDQALLLEFTHFGMWLLGTLSIPLLFIMGPLNVYAGGNSSNHDRLGKLGIGNVTTDHPWLFWAHAVLVWFVVITVQRSVCWAQERFLVRRRNWLRAMPAPRATTILVRDIPEEHRTDAKLKEYFDGIFEEEAVESVHIVKDTSALCDLIDNKAVADLNLQAAKLKASDATGTTAESIEHYRDLCAESERAVKEEKERIRAAATRGDASLLSDHAFVTFKTRRDAEMALKADLAPEGTLRCEAPPDPADVIYSGLRKDPGQEAVSSAVGYAFIAGIFCAALPCVLGIAYMANIEHLAGRRPLFGALAKERLVATLWNAMVGPLALQLLVRVVPALLMAIISRCFVLESLARVQHAIQKWYFWFLVVYVLLIMAVGYSAVQKWDAILAHPDSVFNLMAAAMLFSNEFYLNFVPLQWVAHAWALLRLPQLAKFISLRSFYAEERAKDLSEPEDQAYHGIGSRSARFSFTVALALVLCQLTPLINVLVFIELLLCRLVYGYLVVFAEVRKPDLGGAFWVTNLMNIQRCMRVYILMMSFILCVQDSTYGPCVIAASSYVYWSLSFSRFAGASWDGSLPLEDLMDLPAKKMLRSLRHTYEQPELCMD